MPKMSFAVLIVSVIAAAAASVWLLSLDGPVAVTIALPAVLIAALLIRRLTR